MMKKSLPMSSVDRILRQSGELRISEEAKETLLSLLNGLGAEITAEAAMLAEKEKKKTLGREHIREAFKKVWD